MKLLKKVRKDARRKWNKYFQSLTTTGERVTLICYLADEAEYFSGLVGCDKKDIKRVFTHRFWKLEKARYMRKYHNTLCKKNHELTQINTNGYTINIQNSGSGDVVMGDKNVNTTNIYAKYLKPRGEQ